MSLKRRIAIVMAAVICLLILLFMAGPRPRLEPSIQATQLPADLDAWLAQSEARFPDITPGTGKTIIWAHADKRRTPLSIVYLHGFSATRQEVAPLSDQLAAKLGANLFYTRLAGHGRPGAAMGEASANDWLNDAREALDIAKRLGERVIVVGTSTGATLAAWLAQQPDADVVQAFVMVSPNFGPRDRLAPLAVWPWARYIVPAVAGDEFVWQPRNADQAKYWTTRYPSSTLSQMMSLVYFVQQSPLEKISRPVLIIHSDEDQVVDAAEVHRAFARIGSPVKRLFTVATSQDAHRHVLAGDILAPQDTAAIRAKIEDYLASLK